MSRPQEWDQWNIISAIKAFRARTGAAPVARDLTKECQMPSRVTLIKYFGSVAAAMTAAGFPPLPQTRERNTIAKKRFKGC